MREVNDDGYIDSSTEIVDYGHSRFNVLVAMRSQ